MNGRHGCMDNTWMSIFEIKLPVMRTIGELARMCRTIALPGMLRDCAAFLIFLVFPY